MIRTHFSVALIVLVAGCTPPDPPATTINSTPTLTGKVVSIADGDTLTILVDQSQHKIRLSGIDTPEKAQPFGTKAKQFTSGRVFGKVVSVEVVDRDRYGRTVGVVTLPDGTNLCHSLVAAGLAWWYREYAPDDTTLATLEKGAREAQRGLWADANPIAPWEWRRGKRDASSPARVGYWLNTNSNVRHNPTCNYFSNTKSGRLCEASEGKPCGLCGG